MSIPTSELSEISFYVIGSDDVKYESAVTIRNIDGLKNGKPTPGGIYDDHMGTTSREWSCTTCFNTKDPSKGKGCPGHFGMVPLNYPAENPLFISEIPKWLKCICFNCGRLIMGEDKIPQVHASKILAEYASKAKSYKGTCVYCKDETRNPTILKEKADNTTILIQFKDTEEKKILHPHVIKMILIKITNETVMLMGKLPESHPSKFVLDYLFASPNTIRPDMRKTNGGKSSNNDVTVLLQAVVKFSEEFNSINMDNMKIDTSTKDLINNLQLSIYEMIKGQSTGVTSPKKGIVVNGSGKQLVSITKRLTTKQGRIRKNLLGKRVFLTARSFITCGIELKLDEFGVPIQIAKNIQIPVVVTDYNLEECRNYFRNGNRIYPKCTEVIDPDGNTYISEKVPDIYPGWTIKRDLINGDIANFNRQPSLLGSNITSMKTVVYYEGDTIRLNVISCALFNADFDGDAMNILFTQSVQCRNEIASLNSPANFSISDKDGTPFIGEVQDGTMGLAFLTKTGIKLDKYHVMQMFSSVDAPFDLSEYPNNHIFQGRDVISILLKATGNLISYTGKASFWNKNHEPYRVYNKEDISVVIDRGNLRQGVLDKASIGQGKHSNIFHIVNNKYGADKALLLAFNMQQVANNFLYCHGLTVTMEDLILRRECLDEIHKIEERLIQESMMISESLSNGEIIPPIGKTIKEYVEELQMNALNPGDAFWEHILRSINYDNNNMYNMIIHGAKGKEFNMKNVVAAIGQIEINGARMPEEFNHRSLPYFNRNDRDPASRGYIKNSYSSGLTVCEFIFHSLENRYQLCMKALSTSIAGHQNRVSIKALEQAIVDNIRKVMNGYYVLQYLYGGDAIDTRHLERVSFPTMVKGINNAKFKELYNLKSEVFGSKDASLQKLLDAEFNQLLEDRKNYIEIFTKLERIGDSPYSTTNLMPIDINRIMEDTKFNYGLMTKNPSRKLFDPVRGLKNIDKLIENLPYCLINEIQEKKKSHIPDVLRYATYLLKIYIRSWINTATLVKNNITDDALDKILGDIKNTYIKAIINYGKPVGVIAAQSISEPLTQLVIDSHHTSGASSTKKKGMKRIKEIESVAPTESMESKRLSFSLVDEFKRNKDKNTEIAKKIEMLHFGIFILNWQIFYEKFGKPVHPKFSHETALFKTYFENNPGIKEPSDVSNWCIRIELDKFKLIEKQLTTTDIFIKLKMTYKHIFMVYSVDTSKSIIFRIYLKNSFSKKEIGLPDVEYFITNDLHQTIVRGVDGINATYVQEKKMQKLNEDGEIVDNNIYEIICDGTNVKAIIENQFVDPYTIQSDSITETYDFLGIVATRQKIIDELCSQIEEPNIRHHQMYADIITSTGVPISMTRFKSSQRNAPVLLQIADGSPVKVIKEAAINGYKDNIEGISPPIMLGKNPKIGSLYNTFLLDEDFISSKIQDIDTIIDTL